ncbi:chaplin family protein [Spirillospora sp. CA-128828]|uniref:chaplin family protein n=1 Tax=Spirillospora sp. CA-128828 TaxID=3240033 RepID=UPI003D90CEDD
MRIRARNTSRAALVAAGALAVGAAFGSGVAANAETMYGGGGHDGKVRLTSAGNFGALNGNQVYAPISIPIDVCGNAIAIAGLSRAQCKGGASVSNHRSRERRATESGYRMADGFGSGFGGSGFGGGGGGWDDGGWDRGHKVDMQTAGNFGLLNGNQLYMPISVPIDVCGNAVAFIGAAQARCKGGASVKRAGDDDVKATSTGNFGILNGNQAFVPIRIPINVCGNSAAAFGLAQAQCKGGASVGDGHGHGHKKPHKKPHKWPTPPKHKPYKPSKHRPAVKHTKLPSTTRADGSRIATPAVDQRAANALPVLKGFVNKLRRAVKVPGVDVKPGQVGPQAPLGEDMPVTLGGPALT